MAKNKKKPKLCVYCGKDKSAGKMSMEHFVPQGLWSGRRPLQTRTVPAHKVCNESYAEDDDYFRLVMVSEDAVRDHPEAKKILEGPVGRLMCARPGQYLRYAKDFAIRPKFTELGLYVGHYGCFPIDYTRIERVLQKIVRGLFYAVTKQILPFDRFIRIRPVGSILDKEASWFADRMYPWMTFGDDVFSCRYVFSKGLHDMACLLGFYDRRLYFALTSEK